MIVKDNDNMTCIFLPLKYANFYYLEVEQKDKSYHVSSN